MSTRLLFLLPIGMPAVAWSFCFVGGFLRERGTAPSLPYSDTIVEESGLVAYWPLSDLLTTLDTEGQTSVAADIFDHHNGTYTIPFAYPSTGSANAVQFTKPLSSSSLKRGTSIVPGDAGSTKNPLPASVVFEGGFVHHSVEHAEFAKVDRLHGRSLDQPHFQAGAGAVSVTGGLG